MVSTITTGSLTCLLLFCSSAPVQAQNPSGKAESVRVTVINGGGDDDTAQQIDGVSGATKPVSQQAFSLITPLDLQQFMAQSDTISLLATTNPDGTPLVAVISPTIDTIEAKDMVLFAAAPGKTRDNIDRTGTAMLVVHGSNCAGEQLRGARLLLRQKIMSPSAQKKTKGLRSMQLYIEQFLPLE